MTPISRQPRTRDDDSILQIFKKCITGLLFFLGMSLHTSVVQATYIIGCDTEY